MSLQRIIGSKKMAYAAVVPFANFGLSAFGVDVTQPAVLALDAAFAGLAVAQWALDMRWGSCSDSTGRFAGRSR